MGRISGLDPLDQYFSYAPLAPTHPRMGLILVYSHLDRVVLVSEYACDGLDVICVFFTGSIAASSYLFTGSETPTLPGYT